MSNKKEVIKELYFGSLKEMKEEKYQKDYDLRLEFSNKKNELKNKLKQDILKDKTQKIRLTNEYKVVLGNLKFKLKEDINENNIKYKKIIREASAKEYKIVKQKESKAQKELRLSEIEKINVNKKRTISDLKDKLKTLDKDLDECKVIKKNIKIVNKNAKLEIEQLNKTVLKGFLKEFWLDIKDTSINFAKWIRQIWRKFKTRFPGFAQFFVFFMLSNGITVLQLILMPVLKSVLNQTDLINVALQFGKVGSNLNGTPYYMFNYPAGPIIDGIGGGLAYFLSVQITLAIAQIINFFTQKNITFKSKNNTWKPAVWYFIAYIGITLVAAAAQGLYKAPIYNLLMNTWNLGKQGELFADFITMIINSAISFWVFFPIFKIIFKQEKKEVTNK